MCWVTCLLINEVAIFYDKEKVMGKANSSFTYQMNEHITFFKNMSYRGYRRMISVILFLLLFFLAMAGKAQTPELDEGQLWFALAAQGKVHPKLDLSFQNQFRFPGYMRTFTIMKPQIWLMYNIKPWVGVGIGFHERLDWTDVEKAHNRLFQAESRPAQQVLFRHKKGRFAFQHRFATEQRFYTSVPTGEKPSETKFALRLNYNFGAEIHLYGQKGKPGSLSMPLAAELYWSYAPAAPQYLPDQWRLWALLRYQISDRTFIRGGYLHLWVFKQSANSLLLRNNIFVEAVFVFGKR